MDLKRRVLQALTGIEEDPSPQWGDAALIHGIDDPPTYVVFLTLCGVAGLPWHSEEKMVWRTHIRFRDLQFSIADWKRGSWSIRGIGESADYHSCALQLQRKIMAAARLVEPQLEASFAKDVESGGFYVENSYYRVRPLYEHHRAQVVELESERKRVTEEWAQRAIDAQEDTQDCSRRDRDRRLAQELTTRMNYLSNWTKRLSYAAAPMVVFFFSYTEIILDILFAFRENRGQTFTEFRCQHWDERFKQVLPVSSDRALHRIYQRLLVVKRTSRDPVVHGYGCEEALLVPMERFGLVPVRYAPYARKFYLPYIPVPEESAQRALKVFDEFDEWLDRDATGQYAMLYARSGFHLPFAEERLQKIRGWMQSREAFETELQREAELQDMLQDQWF